MMTECERLQSEGIFDESFFKEEIRDEFCVDSKRKKIWAISIDLLLQVEHLCKKLNIEYFALGGTAIGAVRHKGFIPWDDDIDIGMLRKDYNKFLELSPKMLSAPYFLQTSLSDKGFYNRPFARLRNGNTTGISPGDQSKSINNGIFIDIFPLDGYENKVNPKLFIYSSKIKSAFAWNEVHYESVSYNVVRKLMKPITPIVLQGSIESFYMNHEKKATEFSNKYQQYVGLMYSFFGYASERLIWKKEWFDKSIALPFENVTVSLPVGFHEMLSVEFGDYMQLPPKETRGKHHDLEMEPDINYRTYCSQKYKVQYCR